jgi:hypothetical protein
MRFAAAALLLHTAPNLAAPASGGASAGLPQQHEPTHPGHGQAARVTRASLQHDAAVSLVTFALPLALILLTEVRGLWVVCGDACKRQGTGAAHTQR